MSGRRFFPDVCAGTFMMLFVGLASPRLGAQATDLDGLIKGQEFLALGPIANGYGCSGSDDDLLGNHIAPSFIGCEYPEEGEETVDGVDFSDPGNVAIGFHPGTDEVWRAFDDGSPTDGDLDLDADITGNIEDHMTWLATYVEYTGDGGDFQLCVGSDDGVQVWLNDRLLHNKNACRGRGTCQDLVPFSLDGPGIFCLRIGTWERGGGWGSSIGIQDEFGLPVIDGESEDWIFHGRVRPGDPDDFPCSSLQLPVTNLQSSSDGRGSAEITWENPEGNDPGREITVLVNGGEVATVTGSSTGVTVDLDDGLNSVCVDNDSGSPVCVGVASSDEVYINCGGDEFVDEEGRVWTEDSSAAPSPFLSSGNVHTAVFGVPGDVNVDADEMVVDYEYPADIFNFERWNDGAVEYTVTGLTRGDYEVTLLFMEGCCSNGCEDIDDPALAAGDCRVVDIYLGDDLVDDQFSQNVEASRLAGTLPGADSNYVALVRQYEVEDVDSIRISIDDLGGGNPPENSSIKGIAIVPLGPSTKPKLQPGDANGDGSFNLADPVAHLGFLVKGGALPDCYLASTDPVELSPTGLAILDFNGDGRNNLADAIAGLGRLFKSGAPHVLGDDCTEIAGSCESTCVP